MCISILIFAENGWPFHSHDFLDQEKHLRDKVNSLLLYVLYYILLYIILLYIIYRIGLWRRFATNDVHPSYVQNILTRCHLSSGSHHPHMDPSSRDACADEITKFLKDPLIFSSPEQTNL